MSSTGSATSNAGSWRTAGVVVFCAAGFLLITMGGAIIAAPLTVPLMFVVTHRHPTRAFRAVGALLTGTTVAEVVWAVTYVVGDEAKPWIWLAPLVIAMAVMVAVVRTSDPTRAPGSSRLTARRTA
jgi:hypothetical protein